MPVPEVASALGVTLTRGLSADEVRQRLERHGRNVITPRRGRGALMRFLSQFHSPLVYILVVAVVVTAGLGEWVDSAVILAVVLVNAVVGFVQESRAVHAIEALARTLSAEATVLRDGERRRLDASLLVPGDVVILAAGDRVPADLRVVDERDVHVDESALTGESMAVSKRFDPLPESTPLADRRNMAYASTLVTRGHAVGVVIATGDDTEVGRISGLIASVESIDTPLTRKLAQFSGVLLWLIIAVAAAMFGVGVARGMDVSDTFMAAVAMAIGAIPEGLPAAMTIMLAVGVSRMASRRAIIRKLPAVEALGSTTVICSDKTGTLTENQMTVQHVWAGGRGFEVTGTGYDPAGEIREGAAAADPAAHPALLECLRAGLLCNDASLLRADGRWTIQGDPTEAALIVAAHKAGMTQTTIEAASPRIDVIPFESEHQYMATLHAAPEASSVREGADGEASAPGTRGSAGRLICVKGSVERVLGMSVDMLDHEGRRAPLNAPVILAEAERLSRRGLRVLAFARGAAPPGASSLSREQAERGLTFLGLQGMLDPPRPEAIDAVATCRDAGITVKMITGDHAGTAAAIARMIDLGPGRGASDSAGHGRASGADGSPAGVTEPAPQVVTGATMEQTPDADLPDLAERTHVFARMTPEQKLRLVKALQSRGHVVAMTGDGVNDAPALRQADIGVAMGLGGTEVAKEAADMVLADDNFASIEAAVEEGRTVFDNLTKFIVWTLPTNGAEAMIILAAVVAGQQLPILPVQALYINMTTAVLLGLPLAFEPREADVMARPPRDPRQPIFTFELFMRTGLMSLLLTIAGYGLFEWAQWRGLSDAQARTIAVSVVVFGEAFYLFNCRSLVRSVSSVGWFTNPLAWAGVAAMTLLQVGVAHVPVANRLFQTAPLDLASWGAVIGASWFVALIVSFEKWMRRRAARRG